MAVSLLLFIIGFFILLKGADVLITSASAIARELKVAPFLVGLFIAGIGTSIPEFTITVFSHATGNEAIGLGTILGSNTFNILVVLGAAALVLPLVFKENWITRDLVWNFLAIVIVALFSLVLGPGEISRLEGIAMLALFGGWIYLVVKDRDLPEGSEVSKAIPLRKAFGLSVVGLAGVLVGAEWVVGGAVAVASWAGVSDALVGLTIVSIGTSLPELVVTITAALAGRQALAVGNIIGSNIFDFFVILGVAALIKPMSFPLNFSTDIGVTLAAAVSLFLLVRFRSDRALVWWAGALLIAGYIVYLAYLIVTSGALSS